MALRKTFFMTLFLFFFVWGASSLMALSSKNAEEIARIDSQIEELQRMKRGFESRALRHDSQAEYLQFDDQAYLETRRHWQLAEENRIKAAKVQEEIDKLQVRRQQLVSG